MKKLLFFLPDLFLYVLKSLSVRLYYHLRSLCICIYIFLFSSFFFSIFPPSSFSKNSVDSVAFSTQRRKLFFATRCSTWPCCEMRKTRPFIINLPATKADVSPTTPFFSLPPFFLFSLFSFSLSFFAPLFSLSFPPLLVLPSRVPSVSRSNLFNGIPPNAARFTPRSSFVYLLLAFARALKHRLFFVLNIKLVEGKNFNDREYVI